MKPSTHQVTHPLRAWGEGEQGALDELVPLVALDDALKDISALDPREGKVVELRFFGGLSVEETAEALKISPETVMRDWKFDEQLAAARTG